MNLRKFFKDAEARLLALLGRRTPQPRLEATVCGGCGQKPLVHVNRNRSAEVRCVNPKCPDPRWTSEVTEPNSEGVVGAAIAEWNLVNARPLWTVGEFKRGLAARGSRGLASGPEVVSERLDQDESPRLGGGSRGLFGEKDN